jgi:hypothetical protein
LIKIIFFKIEYELICVASGTIYEIGHHFFMK